MKCLSKKDTATSVIAAPRLLLIGCCALTALALSTRSAQAVVVAGDLVVDLRAADLDGASSTWINRSTSGLSVGDFATQGGGNANVVAGKSDGTETANALFIDSTLANIMVSSATTPSALGGNNTRSVEVWLWADDADTSQAVVGWGSTANGGYSAFRYSNHTGNGKWSGWFIDSGWDGLTAGAWTHVAYTYDGSVMNGYINGVLHDSDTLTGLSNHPLNTLLTSLTVGAGTSSGRDLFTGYIGAVRVHTGVLAPNLVNLNYQDGIDGIGDLLGDFNNDTVQDSLDFAILRDNLFTSVIPGEDGDYDESGFVDLNDYRLFKDDSNTFVGIQNPPPALGLLTAPEPTALICLGVGVVFCGSIRPRRAK